jgi:DNA-binding MarR family transcriptional regulator
MYGMLATKPALNLKKEIDMTNLTTRETIVVNHMINEQNGPEDNSQPIFGSEIAKRENWERRTAGNVLGSLVRKGLVVFGGRSKHLEFKGQFEFFLSEEGRTIAQGATLEEQHIDPIVVAANKSIKVANKAVKKAPAKKAAKPAKIWIANFKEKGIEIEFSADMLDVGVPTSKGVVVMTYPTLKAAKEDLRTRGATIRAK